MDDKTLRSVRLLIKELIGLERFLEKWFGNTTSSKTLPISSSNY
jgi:hypothetical protein